MRRRSLSYLCTLLLAGAFACHETDRLNPVRDEPSPEPVVVTEPPPAPQPAQPPEEPTEQPPEPPLVLDETPTETVDGVPGPMPGVYTDKGPAPATDGIRGLISFPIRNREELEQRIEEIYDPSSPSFRRYYTPEEWIARHAPPEEDVALVKQWLESQGLQVPRIATNRLLLQFTGTVEQFNKAFGASLHILSRKSPQAGNPPHDVYGLNEGIHAPKFIEERIAAVATADLAAETGRLPNEFGQPSTEPPENIEDGLTPRQVASAYGLDKLYQLGYRGRGVKLGVSIGAHFRYKDLRAFWETFGIHREDPIVIQTMEPPVTRYREGTLDVEWAGAMAPEAELRVYMGPDARNTSMVYTFNEAIARGEVSVLTTSFAHREDSEPKAVHEAYGASAMMAAALGITVMAASGDSAGVDVPSSSPYVTAVGGTRLLMDGPNILSEVAWEYSGSGLSRTFPTPPWQLAVASNPRNKRAVVDVALNAETGYWYMFLGVMRPNTGTSFSSPVFAGLIAVINEARAMRGQPVLGWINSHLYTYPAVQATFRDITVGATEKYPAGPGWDYPTGWGAPDAEGLLSTMP